MLLLWDWVSGLKRTRFIGVQRSFNRAAARVLAFFLLSMGPWASVAAQTGEFGGDLALLRKLYAPPGPGQHNHFIDMWDGGRIRSLATAAGLTNNRALFINSHGKGHRDRMGLSYVFYPHRNLGGVTHEAQLFSVGEVAALLGSRVTDIHNVVVAGCDMERSFEATEIRRHFPNATNITHIVSGEAGYQPMFVQAVLSPSHCIEPLYETASVTPQGDTQYQLSPKPSSKAKKLTPYIAELFKPGGRKPFKTQLAGRELIDPPGQIVPAVQSARNRSGHP